MADTNGSYRHGHLGGDVDPKRELVSGMPEPPTPIYITDAFGHRVWRPVESRRNGGVEIVNT